MKMYSKGTFHRCKVCGAEIITLYKDPEYKHKVEGDEICWPCQEFGGPIDDMPGLWDRTQNAI